MLCQKDFSGDGSHRVPATVMGSDLIRIPVKCNGFHLKQKQIILNVSILS